MIRISTLLLIPFVFQAAAAVEIMPLQDIKPGMDGEFRTVIEGTEIQSFPIRIVGVANNFVGPKRSVIFAEALDEENQTFGPVSGMSGSPVYIDGKLIGAYAYGYSFSKEQALFGIQPIEHMLEIAELHPPEYPVMGNPRPAPMDRMEQARVLSSDGREPETPLESLPVAGPFEAMGGVRVEGERRLLAFDPRPMPLSLGGFSARTVNFFRPLFAEMGLDVMQAPVGAAGEASYNLPLDPGSPVAGVLLSGDFSAAAVGTITFRDGDRLLAFGHPFFQNGPTEMPMASAEILTVVQSLSSSFKLSNIGPVVGSIYQDRLTGIAGEIGREAPTAQLNIAVDAPGKIRREYSGDLFEHKQLSPTLAAMAMMETLFSTMESENEQTIFSRAQLDLEGYDPIVIRDVASGSSGPNRMILDFFSIYFSLLNNPFTFPKVESIDFDFRLEDSWNQQILEQVVVESGEAVAGEPLQVQVVMRDYLGQPVVDFIDIPIPSGTEGDILTIELGDAAFANKSWAANRNGSMYFPRPDARSLEDIVEEVRDRRGFQAYYARVLQPGEGVSMRGRDMDNLPPSIMASIASPKTAEVMKRTALAEIWNGSFPTEGEFRGSYAFRVQVRD